MKQCPIELVAVTSEGFKGYANLIMADGIPIQLLHPTQVPAFKELIANWKYAEKQKEKWKAKCPKCFCSYGLIGYCTNPDCE